MDAVDSLLHRRNRGSHNERQNPIHLLTRVILFLVGSKLSSYVALVHQTVLEDEPLHLR